MIHRVLISAGLFLLGYYVGKEVGRLEPIREELRKVREKNETPAQTKSKAD